MSETSQTNVDYLLEKFTISEIIDIQNKLKTDIDRKKQELKQLVGERYGDLIEAVDTIKQMNQSVDYVLNSLQTLTKRQSNHLLATNKSSYERINGSDGQHFQRNVDSVMRYKCGLILKLVIEMPLNIWTSLENEDLLRATYDYFYGQHLCELFEQLVPRNETPNLLKQYKTAINRFNEVIVKKCWHFDKKSSLMDIYDESVNADIFCCLLLLQDMSPKRVFLSILEKRKSHIRDCFDENHHFREILHNFMNLLFNTIKCIHSVFFTNSGSKSKTLLHQRYERMTKMSFESTFLKTKNLTNELTSGLIDFKISPKTNIEVIDNEMIKSNTKDWMSDMKASIEPLLTKMFQSIDSVNSICVALNETNEYLRKSQKLNDWVDYCEDLMTSYLPVWDHFIIGHFEDIVNKSLAYEDLEVLDFIWIDSENRSSSLSKKALAQNPIIDVFCSDLDHSLQYLLNDMKVIKDFNFKLIQSNDLEAIETHLMDVCHKIIEDMKNLFESDNKEIILFSAQFFRQITHTCPHLRQCFESSSPNRQYSWSKTKDLLLSYSYNSYKKLFDLKIKQLFVNTNGDSLTDLNAFIHNSSVWDSIQTTEMSDEGKEVTSKIEVPLQMSSFLHNNFTQLSNEINRLTGHTIPRVVVIDILSALSQQLTQVYGNACDCLSTNEYPKSIKQVIALQLYFDLLFFKQFLGTTRDESIKGNEMNKIQDLLQRCETFIDPFDLHVFFPHIQTNVAKLSRTTAVILGLLLPDHTLAISDPKSKQSTQMNEIHNIMTFHCTNKALVLLNVTSISKK
ncbi:unnamed protein product [Oppiella nova]|uniref:Conserved oligomeric Golgi complex subunit 1 n=1 Tax=Oppiella nova TaxID=334625 RepID=A0A7R9LAJ8_9ACAR|nr:unnamed protein product [Oppiella nova]CAG2159777.1 unnamed protein product [Oppiella nova]